MKRARVSRFSRIFPWANWDLHLDNAKEKLISWKWFRVWNNFRRKSRPGHKAIRISTIVRHSEALGRMESFLFFQPIFDCHTRFPSCQLDVYKNVCALRWLESFSIAATNGPKRIWETRFTNLAVYSFFFSKPLIFVKVQRLLQMNRLKVSVVL